MKALIIGSDPTGHEVTVQTAFEAGGGVDSDIYESALNQTLVDYATTNNYDAIIYSYTGEENYFTLANSNPDIMIFMPSDSYTGDLQQLVLTDNLPSSDDYEFGDSTQASQSESNGYICGQLFYIASQCDCSLQEARIRANATKDSDSIINTNLAINYQGSTELTVGSASASRTALTVSLTIDRVVDATGYKIYRNGIQLTDQTTLTYDDTIDYGVHEYTYKGYNSNLTSALSETTYVRHGKGTLLVA